MRWGDTYLLRSQIQLRGVEKGNDPELEELIEETIKAKLIAEERCKKLFEERKKIDEDNRSRLAEENN